MRLEGTDQSFDTLVDAILRFCRPPQVQEMRVLLKQNQSLGSHHPPGQLAVQKHTMDASCYCRPLVNGTELR